MISKLSIYFTQFYICFFNFIPFLACQRHSYFTQVYYFECNFIKGKNVPQLYFKEYGINGDFFIAIGVFVIFRAWDSIRAIKRFKKKTKSVVQLEWTEVRVSPFFVCFLFIIYIVYPFHLFARHSCKYSHLISCIV